MKSPKLEVWKNKAGEWQWHLKASNGEILAAGEGYMRKAGALQGVTACRRAAAMAQLVVIEPT